MSVDSIEYVPPEIEGNLPVDVLRTALSEKDESDVWKVVVMQIFFQPSTGRAKYQVSAHHYLDPHIGGLTRDYFFDE